MTQHPEGRTTTSSIERRPFRAVRNVQLLYALGLLTMLQPGLAVWVVYLTDFRHLTLAEVGVMELFFWGAKVLLEVPSGAFADRFGRRRTFAFGLVLEATGVTLFAFAGSFWLLLISYVLWSGGVAFRSGNDQAYMYDTLAAVRRGHEFTARMGVYQALVSVAMMTSGVGGSWLASRTTLQVPLALGAVPFLFAAVVVVLMQEPPASRAALDAGAEAEGNAPPARLGYRETLAVAIATVRANPLLRYALLFQIALVAAFEADILLLQPFLAAQGVPLALFGLLQVPVRLGHIVGSVAAARVLRATGVFGIAGGTLTLAAGGLALLAIVDHPVAFVGFVAVQIAMGALLPGVGAYVNDRTDSRIRATILSVVPLGMSLSFALTGPLLGIAGNVSLRLAFGGMAVLILATAGPLLVLWRRAERGAR